MRMRIVRENLNLKWYLCLLFQRHKWGYTEGIAKPNYNCPCESSDCSIPVYDLTCSRCGLSIILAGDELIDYFAANEVDSDIILEKI